MPKWMCDCWNELQMVELNVCAFFLHAWIDCINKGFFQKLLWPTVSSLFFWQIWKCCIFISEWGFAITHHNIHVCVGAWRCNRVEEFQLIPKYRCILQRCAFVAYRGCQNDDSMAFLMIFKQINLVHDISFRMRVFIRANYGFYFKYVQCRPELCKRKLKEMESSWHVKIYKRASCFCEQKIRFIGLRRPFYKIWLNGGAN